MNLFRFTLLAGSFALIASIALTLPQDVYGQAVKDVVVSNNVDKPVPTKNVENPARQAFQIGFDIPNVSEPPEVPAGKIFVIEYVSAGLRTVTPFGSSSPCRIYELAIGSYVQNPAQPEPFYFAPVLMGSGTGVNGEVSMYTLSQPVKIYARAGMPIAANWSAGPVCGSPGIQGRMVLSGYLVDATQ